MMLYNFCMKGVLGQNKKWQIGKIFCEKWPKKAIFAQKWQKTARSRSSEVLRGLRSSGKVNWMMLYNFCNKRVLGQNKKWQIGKIFYRKWVKIEHFSSKMTENYPSHGRPRYLEAWEVYPRLIGWCSTTSATREFLVRTKSCRSEKYSVKIDWGQVTTTL